MSDVDQKLTSSHRARSRKRNGRNTLPRGTSAHSATGNDSSSRSNRSLHGSRTEINLKSPRALKSPRDLRGSRETPTKSSLVDSLANDSAPLRTPGEGTTSNNLSKARSSVHVRESLRNSLESTPSPHRHQRSNSMDEGKKSPPRKEKRRHNTLRSASSTSTRTSPDLGDRFKKKSRQRSRMDTLTDSSKTLNDSGSSGQQSQRHNSPIATTSSERPRNSAPTPTSSLRRISESSSSLKRNRSSGSVSKSGGSLRKVSGGSGSAATGGDASRADYLMPASPLIQDEARLKREKVSLSGKIAGLEVEVNDGDSAAVALLAEAREELTAVERELRHVQRQHIVELKKHKMVLVGRIGGLKIEMKRERANKNNAALLAETEAALVEVDAEIAQLSSLASLATSASGTGGGGGSSSTLMPLRQLSSRDIETLQQKDVSRHHPPAELEAKLTARGLSPEQIRVVTGTLQELSTDEASNATNANGNDNTSRSTNDPITADHADHSISSSSVVTSTTSTTQPNDDAAGNGGDLSAEPAAVARRRGSYSSGKASSISDAERVTPPQNATPLRSSPLSGSHRHFSGRRRTRSPPKLDYGIRQRHLQHSSDDEHSQSSEYESSMESVRNSSRMRGDGSESQSEIWLSSAKLFSSSPRPWRTNSGMTLEEQAAVMREIQTDAHKLLPPLPTLLPGFVDKGARAAAHFLQRERTVDAFPDAFVSDADSTIEMAVRSARLSLDTHVTLHDERLSISASARTRSPPGDIRLPHDGTSVALLTALEKPLVPPGQPIEAILADPAFKAVFAPGEGQAHADTAASDVGLLASLRNERRTSAARALPSAAQAAALPDDDDPSPDEPDDDGKPKKDKWGFEIDAEGCTHTPTPVDHHTSERERSRAVMWVGMLSNWNAVVRKGVVKQRCRKGIPDRLRGLMWKRICNADDVRRSNPNLFEELLVQDSPHEPQISRDITRTFTSHSMFREKGGEGQRRLFNVLKAYSVFDPEVGYCQGMGFLSATLMIYMSAEDTFACLTTLCQQYELAGLFKPGFPLLHEFFYVHERLLEKHLPRVAQHFAQEMIVAGLYATHWYSTLFSYTLPFRYVVRIMDLFLSERFKMIFRVAIVLLKMHKNDFVGKSFDVIVTKLKQLNNLDVDPDELIRLTLECKISDKEIEKLRKEYHQQANLPQ